MTITLELSDAAAAQLNQLANDEQPAAVVERLIASAVEQRNSPLLQRTSIFDDVTGGEVSDLGSAELKTRVKPDKGFETEPPTDLVEKRRQWEKLLDEFAEIGSQGDFSNGPIDCSAESIYGLQADRIMGVEVSDEDLD